MQRTLAVLYVLLVLLMLAQGIWWVVFITGEAGHVAREAELRLVAERELAARLLAEGGVDPGGLTERFPDLTFTPDAGSTAVAIAPDALGAVHDDARRRQRMLVSEGIFFLVLLSAGSVILLVAVRRERDFRRAHELFLAGVTHEFRTPLASVRLHAETLNRPELDPERSAEVRRRLIADVDRLEALVGHVLGVTRQAALDRGDPERIDLADATREVVDEVAALVERDHGTLTLRLPPGHTFRGHRALLTVALRNLLVNAIEHGRHGDDPPEITVELMSSDGHHALAVGDRGPGIPKQSRSRVFRSFYRIEREDRAHRRRRGAGLGLYLARRNVESMGGRIELSSRKGKGATFTIILPAEVEG
jgi:signal transduction histidine kinase